MTSPHAGTAALDADLARAVRRTAHMRQGFYVVVLLVALAGQVSGAVEALHIPLLAAIPAVGALELGGIVVLSNADVRRRLGERATASRILSVAIAAGAVAFNWLAHADHLLGGFFAGMSALGYLVWLMHTENQRRDRLRATGHLPAVTPAYELVGHWLAHPWLTRRARSLTKADPQLGLYGSLARARSDVRRERREAAIASVLHRKVRAAVKDKDTADIAVHVYDLDVIAAQLAADADYPGLTALIAADLEPARLATAQTTRTGKAASDDKATAEVVREVANEPAPAAPGEPLSLIEVTSPREVVPTVALPAQIAPPTPPTVVVVTPEPAPVPARRSPRSSVPNWRSAALRRAIRHPRPGTPAQPVAQVTPEVAPTAPEKPANGRPAATALPVTTRAQLLVRMLASGGQPKPADVARVLGTENLSHVTKTLRESAQKGDAEQLTPPGPNTPRPPSRPQTPVSPRPTKKVSSPARRHVPTGPVEAPGDPEPDQQASQHHHARLATRPLGAATPDQGPAAPHEDQ